MHNILTLQRTKRAGMYVIPVDARWVAYLWWTDEKMVQNAITKNEATPADAMAALDVAAGAALMKVSQ